MLFASLNKHEDYFRYIYVCIVSNNSDNFTSGLRSEIFATREGTGRIKYEDGCVVFCSDMEDSIDFQIFPKTKPSENIMEECALT